MRVPEPSPRHAGATLRETLDQAPRRRVLSESKVSGQVQMRGTVLRPRPASPAL